MNLRYTLLSIALLAVLSLLLVPSVFADHGWLIQSVTCDPNNNSIRISGTNQSGSSTDTDVYVDGVFLGSFSGPGNDGPESFTVSDPSFAPGAEIFVENTDGASVGGPSSASTTCGDDVEDNGQFFEPGDDRINRQAYAPIAIYCAETRLEIYAIDADGAGTIALVIDYASLPATPTDENLEFERTEDGRIRVWRLTSGEYVATAGPDSEGKTYMLLWDGCPETYIQAYIEQNGVVTPTEIFPR